MELTKQSELNITDKINILLSLVKKGNNKCLEIGTIITYYITQYHHMGVVNNDILIDLTHLYNSVVDSSPEIKYHDDCCLCHDEYLKNIKEITNLILQYGDNSVKYLEQLPNPHHCINMNLLNELPLELAIKQNNMNVVKWLVSKQAILYEHIPTTNKRNQHVPNFVSDKEYPESLDIISCEILKYIIDNYAYGHPKPMLLFTLRIYYKTISDDYYNIVHTLINKYSYIQWINFGCDKNALIYCFKRFNHKEKYMAHDLQILYKKISNNITNGYGYATAIYRKPCFSLIAFIIIKCDYKLIHNFINLYDKNPLKRPYFQNIDEYDFAAYINKDEYKNVNLVITCIKNNSINHIDEIIESGYVFNRQDIIMLFSYYKYNYVHLQQLYKWFNLKYLTASMFSVELLRLIFDNSMFDKKSNFIKLLYNKYICLRKYDFINQWIVYGKLRKEYELNFVNTYILN